MCYQARQGQAVVPRSAVPEDTIPTQPAVPTATLVDLQLTALLLCGSTQSRRELGFLPPSYGDRNFTLWTYEGLLNKRSKASRALCLAPPNFSCIDLRILLNFCLSKFVEEKKNHLRKSAGKLNSFAVIKTTEICREKPHRIFLLPHIQELIFSLLDQFEPLPIIHCSTKQSKTQKCAFDSRNKDFKVLFHSPEELLNTSTMV